MKTENIRWDAKTKLYVLAINEFVKFGITNNWQKREKRYNTDFLSQPFHLVKTYDFENRWHAELIEQVVKLRLWDWIVSGTHEYAILPLSIVMDCIEDTIEILRTNFFKLEYIHKNGKDRWVIYRQLSDTYFTKLAFPEFDKNNIISPIGMLYVKAIKDTGNRSKGAFGLILMSDGKVLKEIVEYVADENFNRLELLTLNKAFDLLEIKRFKQIEIVSNSNYILSKIRMIETGKRIAVQNDPDENQDLWELLYTKFSSFEIKALNLRDEFMIRCLQNAHEKLKSQND